MTTKEFIEKAIKGGMMFGNEHHELDYYDGIEENTTYELCPEKIILDPKSWQAVGKVDGWGEYSYDYKRNESIDSKWYMHRMIDALCEGKTIDEYLQTL